ncbi:MAG: thioredoxin [Candidatus Pacearchaeota archaeon]
MKKEIIIEVNENNFKEKVINKSKEIPIVVDFWADWCMPCLMLSPILESLAKKFNGKFILAKANIDDTPYIAKKYNITTIPSVKMIKNGEITDEFIGLIPEEEIEKWINKNL